LEPFFSLLKSYGFNPQHIIYVGANKGTWTKGYVVFSLHPLHTCRAPRSSQGRISRTFSIVAAKLPGSTLVSPITRALFPFTISCRDDSSTVAGYKVARH